MTLGDWNWSDLISGVVGVVLGWLSRHYTTKR